MKSNLFESIGSVDELKRKAFTDEVFEAFKALHRCKIFLESIDMNVLADRKTVIEVLGIVRDIESTTEYIKAEFSKVKI